MKKWHFKHYIGKITEKTKTVQIMQTKKKNVTDHRPVQSDLFNSKNKIKMKLHVCNVTYVHHAREL